MDYKSAFNTIIPVKLFDKLKANWGFNTPLLSGFWIFLQNRTQVVKINHTLSSLKTISVGAPQGCVLSPLLYSVYTNDCVSHCNSVQIFKFADDTTLIGLITNDNESDYRREVSTLFDWSCTHNFEVECPKNKGNGVLISDGGQMLFAIDYQWSGHWTVQCFKFLGTTISATLKWDDNLRALSKISSKAFFLKTALKSWHI